MPDHTHLTPAIIAEVCATIETGSTVADAAAGAGFSYSTVKAWRKQGRSDAEAGLDTIHAEFFLRTSTSLAKAKNEIVGVVKRAATLDWRAGVRWLERMDPKWTPKDKRQVEHTMVGRDDLMGMVAQMAAVVHLHVKDRATLDAISAGWLELLEPGSAPAVGGPISATARLLDAGDDEDE